MTAEGQELNGRYRLTIRLATGGMGSVWRAEDLLLQRTVAVKELVPSGIAVREGRARAVVEARAMARVRHPAIVHIHDLLFVGEDPWIVMDYISGRPLAETIRDERHLLDEKAIAGFALPVVDGLRAVHAVGVVHRDVKPTNILVARDGSVVLVDFGIAKIVGDAAFTGTSLVLGTTEFLAPERFGNAPAGPPADLWSVGVTLFCAMEGYSPFLRRGERSMEATVAAILYEDPPEPQNRGRLAEVVLRLLRKDPSERPDAAAVAEVLESILGGRTRLQSAHAGPTLGCPGRSDSHPASAPLRGMPIADAVEIVSGSSTDAGVSMLLAMPEEHAARILSRCKRRVAASLLGGMVAEAQAQSAGTILQIIAATRAGQVLDHVSPSDAASILATMSADEAMRILRESDIRTAAGALAETPGTVSAPLLRATPEARAAQVLSHMRPSRAAALLKVVSVDLRGRLLRRLNPAFRDLVMRYL